MGLTRFAAVSSSSSRIFAATARWFLCNVHLGPGLNETASHNGSTLYQWRKYGLSASIGDSQPAKTLGTSQNVLTGLHPGTSERVSSRVETTGVVSYATSSQPRLQLPQRRSEGVKGAKTGRGRAATVKVQHQRPIVFECRECHAMCVTKIPKDPYERGVVILRCMDCRTLNLVSDRLDLLRGTESMLKFLRERCRIDVQNDAKRIYAWTPESLPEQQQPSIVSQ